MPDADDDRNQREHRFPVVTRRAHQRHRRRRDHADPGAHPARVGREGLEQRRGATGSGCSAWIPKPPWQHDRNCPGRMVADAAADADPNTGPAIYDTHDHLGWTIIGGTSAASPFIAGVIALAGHPGLFPTAARLYTHHTGLHDITTGTNTLPGGSNCGGDYQCHAVPGYDGPTGNGTPNGLASFSTTRTRNHTSTESSPAVAAARLRLAP